ncbi:HTH-type transcriptional regulator YesS [Paenibacillus konkukensis]|uniref:HTH-type transcriptional regulator YesS n=1 Tax=Paenibacillus konkukensis TaxID=2020716 RepID=A0ABY4RUU2_9BACL|nr:helix-turn-helix domain-containing protein [Paenibacillus konkukensis]UQZ85504.1 HTH-type transcriptional regulator YesS [Paenibacillus konkukensis]
MPLQVVRDVADGGRGVEDAASFGAENMYVNYSYLSRTFKEVTGESFSDYVLRLRMEKVKEPLAQGIKVYDATGQVGYKHVNYFSKSFQKYGGMKPSDVNK